MFKFRLTIYDLFLFSFAVVNTTKGQLAFLKEPVSLNISYGETAPFFCSVRGDEFGGRPYWIIGGEETRPGTTLHQGYQTWYNGSGLVRSSVLYVNGSFYANNNLKIQCGVRNMLTSIAVLKIRGIISSLNLSVFTRTEKSILLKWSKPAMFIDAHNYTIIVSNLALKTEENVTVDGNATEYSYIPRNEGDYCSPLKFCVMSLRSTRIGEVIGCITTSMNRGIVMNGPVESTMFTEKKSHISYSCNVTCSESSLFTWIANGKQLQSLPHLRFSTTNNFLTVCDTRVGDGAVAMNPVYTEALEIEAVTALSIELQCVSIFHCSNGSEDCISSVCFSHVAHLMRQWSGTRTDLVSMNFTTEEYYKKQASQSNGSHIFNWYNYKEGYVLLGTTIGLGIVLVLICTVCIVLVFLYFKQRKSHHKVCFTATTPKLYQDETLYDLCRGPTLKNESFYDKPKTPSPQPNMQACEAYSTLPDLI